ncbi:hypothetical protein CO218_04455 [Lactiplantibacillus plantarum]|nr:hypothetical protein CO218_04455 [Lactiplantibacillus plantarum]QBJ56128.1 hypothetical protein C3O83_09180 [Lactiplantibacillus plantarum]
MANTVSGYADKFVQKFGLNLQSTESLLKIKFILSRPLSRQTATIRSRSRLQLSSAQRKLKLM